MEQGRNTEREEMHDRQREEHGGPLQEAENRVGRYSSSPAVLSLETLPFRLVMPGLGGLRDGSSGSSFCVFFVAADRWFCMFSYFMQRLQAEASRLS